MYSKNVHVTMSDVIKYNIYISMNEEDALVAKFQTPTSNDKYIFSSVLSNGKTISAVCSFK